MRGFVRALLSLHGRLRRGHFWLAWLLVFVGGAYCTQSRNETTVIVGLVTLYVTLCVYGKRLHDFGKTAWYMIVPIGATCGAYAYVATSLSRTTSWQQFGDEVRITYLFLLALWILVTLWVGIHPSQKGDNRFGMDPAERHRVPTAPPRGTS